MRDSFFLFLPLRGRDPVNLIDSIQRCSVPLTGYPQEAEVPKAANTRKNRENVNEQLFVATERNAKLRYEGYKKLSEM